MRFFNKINVKKGILMALPLLLIVCMVMIPTNLEGKIQIPAEIKIKMQENAVPGMPLNIIIDAESRMPFRNGHIDLIFPSMGNLQSKTIELWSGDSETYMERHLSYLLPPFTPGEYEIKASFKFNSTGDGEQEMGVMEVLYIDARVDKILTSNISFTHIKQLELKEELGSKGLKGLSLSQIKEKNPEMAERIMRLNRIEAVESNQQKEEKSEEKDFIYNPAEDRIDKHPETDDAREIKKAPLTGTKEVIINSNQGVGANKEEKDAFRTGKAPLIGTKEVVLDSNQPIGADKEKKDAFRTRKAPLAGTKEVVLDSNQPAGADDKEKKDAFRDKKAPLVGEKEYISVPNQPQGLKDNILAPAKVPLESMKEIVEIKMGEMKKDQVTLDSTDNNYKNSAQANEKRKTLEKK